jgi:hypothetical protein
MKPKRGKMKGCHLWVEYGADRPAAGERNESEASGSRSSKDDAVRRAHDERYEAFGSRGTRRRAQAWVNAQGANGFHAHDDGTIYRRRQESSSGVT